MTYYVGNIPAVPTDIQHFGIKGMHWGIRRFQNEDGSYTSAGRSRYGLGDSIARSIQNKVRDHSLAKAFGQQVRATSQAWDMHRDRYKPKYTMRDYATAGEIGLRRGLKRAGAAAKSGLLGIGRNVANGARQSRNAIGGGIKNTGIVAKVLGNAVKTTVSTVGSSNRFTRNGYSALERLFNRGSGKTSMLEATKHIAYDPNVVDKREWYKKEAKRFGIDLTPWGATPHIPYNSNVVDKREEYKREAKRYGIRLG